jgi:RNA methyltransferase, TrmH family
MARIASPANPRLKAARRLATKRERERSGRFLAEGEDLIAAAQLAGREALEGFRVVGARAGGAGFHEVDAAALAHASTLGSGTRVMAVYEQSWLTAPVGPLCVCLWGVADPGNVGTVLRGAEAFGAASVALGPGCADPHSPKAVRASMGAIFSVALARVSAVEQLPGTRVALAGGASTPLDGLHDGLARSGAVTLVVGAERDGLSREVLAACDVALRIPIRSESLNAAMAATVALYELSRERPDAPGGEQTSRVRAS